MKNFCALITFSVILWGLQGCSTPHGPSNTHAPSMPPSVASSAGPIMVKVLSSTPLSQPNASESTPQTNDMSNGSKDAKTPQESKSSDIKNEFQVVFEYKGQTFATVLPFDPGETLMIQGEAPQTEMTSAYPGAYPGNLYVLPPLGMPYFAYPAFGFFSAYPVYYSRGFYHRFPTPYYNNPGSRFHPIGPRGRGRK
jgi:hypothetical protein